VVAALLSSCATPPAPYPPNAVVIGTLLPFTGNESGIGRNLEQAMLLAVEDLNAAGGLGGQPFGLLSRDSNSGSQRGLNQLLELLYNDQVAYLVGPEENALAQGTVSDIEALDVFNMLPGYAAPSVAHVQASGAWMRLAPAARDVGCALAKRAALEGAKSANVLNASDDYNGNVASYFASLFGRAGGTVLPSVAFQPGADSYAPQLESVFGEGADRTLLCAYPDTASTIVTEWTISGHQGSWLLGPALRADVFLVNIPIGSLDGYFGASPSLSLASECEVVDPVQDTLSCGTRNADRFAAHFSARWNGDVPFPAAHFYYDGVVLLAMGLQYARATTGGLPSSAITLHQTILDLNASGQEAASWADLGTAMTRLGAGHKVRYVGAAAEYDFDQYGAAQYSIMDGWTIKGTDFIDLGPVSAVCPAVF
jgi:neutral amino acid transport system substrate-binding protein